MFGTGAPRSPNVPGAPMPPVSPRRPMPPVAPGAPMPPVAPGAPIPPVAPGAPIPPVAPGAPTPPVAPGPPVPPLLPLLPLLLPPPPPLLPLLLDPVGVLICVTGGLPGLRSVMLAVGSMLTPAQGPPNPKNCPTVEGVPFVTESAVTAMCPFAAFALVVVLGPKTPPLLLPPSSGASAPMTKLPPPAPPNPSDGLSAGKKEAEFAQHSFCPLGNTTLI